MSADETTRVVVWGAAGHAMVVADILRLRPEYELVGFLDSVNTERWNRPFCGSRVLGGVEQLEALWNEGVRSLVFGFGDCQGRARLAEVVRQKGFAFATAVHPNAVIAADASLGAGTVVMAGAIVNSGAVLGENVIINTGASVDHECIIGDSAHISPGAHLAGRVQVGQAAWIGIGATLIDGVRVGAGAVVGAGSVVLKDVPARTVAYGVPARSARETVSVS